MNRSNHPDKYEEDCCEYLIAHMAIGYSFASFAACMGVSVHTLYVWAKKHPAFGEAKAIGEAKLLLELERRCILAVDGIPSTFDVSIFKRLIAPLRREINKLEKKHGLVKEDI